jgi:hypothetical protein
MATAFVYTTFFLENTTNKNAAFFKNLNNSSAHVSACTRRNELL